MLFPKTASFSKIFFFVSLSGLVTYGILALYSIRTAHLSKVRSKNVPSYELIFSPPKHRKRNSADTNLQTKYILMLSPNYEDVIEGKYHFERQRCHHLNCFLTARHTYKDKRNFDAIVMQVKELYEIELPRFRLSKQKYIFHGTEAPSNKLACYGKFHGFFNWTWSYRLNSDIVSPFFEVRDLFGDVVAPRINARWWSNETTTNRDGDDLLIHEKKTRAVLAFFNNCRIRERKNYAKQLRSSLEYYSLTLDIHGCDGSRGCPNETLGGCGTMIENDYYFVLVQEESFAEDYLTDSALMAYWNNAVPLVRSGAHLNNFLPPGSYINVRHKSVNMVAALINYVINNPAVYYSYFRWKKFYTFHKKIEFNGVCELCALLNNNTLVGTHWSYSKLRKWWYNTTDDEALCANVTEEESLRGKRPPLIKDIFLP